MGSTEATSEAGAHTRKGEAQPAVASSEPSGPIARVIEACATHPVLTLFLVAILAGLGVVAIRHTPLDAIPDLSDTQVIILTEWPGRSPDLVEDQVTYPISSALVSAPRIKFVRGQSFFGLSFVYAIFEDGTDVYWARSRVLEYLNTVQGKLPADAVSSLGPDATGVGWVFSYALVDTHQRYDLAQLRTLQDWTVRYALAAVPGVAEVASIGGQVKTYQVQVDPGRLRAHGIPIGDVIKAVRESNEDAGGRILEIAGHEHMIRGRGYLKSLDDIRGIPIALGADGVPVTVAQVAEVSLGPDLRRGIADLNGEGEVAGGIVVMRTGENALAVIDAVKARLDELKGTLPDGVDVVITYDRSDLILAAIDTLRSTLIEEMLVVGLILLIFLLHVRSALVPLLTLPVAVLLAFIPMAVQGVSANIMSLGGIAVAIGAMVDASIIIIENVHKKLEEWDDAGGLQGPTGAAGRRRAIIVGMQEVGPSIFFSLLVITVSFVPVFTLEASEGRLFRPLALTKTWSMGFAALLAVTMTPAMVVLLIRGRVRHERDHPISRVLVAVYAPVVRFVVRFRWWVVGAAVVVVGATVPAFLALDSEFMPPLNEGAILYMPSAPPGMGATEASSVLQAMDRELKKVPEVVSVFGKMGRADTATDPAPLGMAEITIVLKPRSEWRPGLSYDDLVAEMNANLQVPGMPNVWWMPIQTRTEMLATGVRSPLAIQVYGDTLETIEAASLGIERALRDQPGTRSIFAERSTGGFFMDIEIKRDAAARYGVRMRNITEAVQSAIGGLTVGEVLEGRARFPISVRYARDFRDTPEALRDVLVTTPTGEQIPLTSVAEIVPRTGPPMIRSEDGKLAGFVFVDTGATPVASWVQHAKETLAAADRNGDVHLDGVRLAWVGQFQSLERASDRLSLIVPITLVLVLLLLYWNTRSVVESGIVLLAVPFSLVGAVWLLWGLDYHLSVAVGVGLIALAGLDAETGVVMLLYLKLAWKKSRDEGLLVSQEALTETIVDGAARRVRPKLMTVVTTMMALLPVLWSDGTGADVMKRIAAPMVGGLVTSFALELLVYPALFAIWKGRGLPMTATQPPEGPSASE